MSDKVYIATTSAVVFINGERRNIKAGISRASEEFAGKYPHLFEEAEGVHFGVEQATAAPGEKRGKHVCDVCGDTAKTGGGLAAHKRSHA